MSRELPSDLLLAVGLRLTATRLALFLTQEAMAKAIGVERNAYANWEGGTRLAQVPAMLRLSLRFGISLDWIYGGQLAAVPFDIANRLQHHAQNIGAPIGMAAESLPHGNTAAASPPAQHGRQYPRRLSLHRRRSKTDPNCDE